jgi:DNA topoisomerase IB
VRGEKTFFRYTAKGGIEREVEITDRPTATVVRQLLARPDDAGDDLLAYETDDGWRDVTSDEINAFLKEVSGAEITAKDFRTWNATVMMAEALARATPPKSRTGRKKVITAAYKQVSEQLGNTPAVAKASYVDPRVVDRFENGEKVADALEDLDDADGTRDLQRTLEQAVCRLLSA